MEQGDKKIVYGGYTWDVMLREGSSETKDPLLARKTLGVKTKKPDGYYGNFMVLDNFDLTCVIQDYTKYALLLAKSAVKLVEGKDPEPIDRDTLFHVEQVPWYNHDAENCPCPACLLRRQVYTYTWDPIPSATTEPSEIVVGKNITFVKYDSIPHKSFISCDCVPGKYLCPEHRAEVQMPLSTAVFPNGPEWRERLLTALPAEGLMAYMHELNELRNFKARLETIYAYTEDPDRLKAIGQLISEFRKG